MMNFKLHLLLIVSLIVLLATFSLAEEPAVAGTVTAGESGYEVAIEVDNWKNEPLTNVVVNVAEIPQGLINVKVTPPLLESLAAKKTATFIVYFDVAENAEAQGSVELVFAVTAEKTEFDQPNPRLALAIAAPATAAGATAAAGSSTPDGSPVSGKTNRARGPYVFVLTEIEAQDFVEHEEGQLGYLYRVKKKGFEQVEVIRCLECPKQFTLGEKIRFELEGRSRVDNEKYRCPQETKSAIATTIDFLLDGTDFEEFSAIAKESWRLPNCAELGVRERLVPAGEGYAHVPYTVIDPVALTLEAGLSAQAEFRFVEQTTEDKGEREAFSYTASYRSSGELRKEDRDGKLFVTYEDSASHKNLSTLPGDNQIGVKIGHMYLTYRLQQNGQPVPLKTVAMTLPAEFSKPHLVSQPVVVESPPEKQQQEKAPAPEIVPNEVELPDLLGKTYAEAVTMLEAVDLYGLPPELGSPAPSPAFVGRVELAVPAVDGPLRPGDKVGLRLFGKAVVGVPVPNVVGRAVRDAAREIETAGLVADFELGAETTDPQKAQTVASQTPMPGVAIEAGTTVKMQILTLKEKTITVPDLRNSAIAKVDLLLRQAGLKMDAQLGDLAPNSRQQSGQVYRQSPPPGLEVKAGAVVEVWVYGEYQDAVPSVKETAPPAETATEFCSLGKANFPYQPDREYFVFRSREPRKPTSGPYSRKYKFLADNAHNAQAAVRQIQQEGKMELVFTGKLPGLCPHLRENCAYSTLNHADGSFFGDICGKWADPVRASVAQRPASMPDLAIVKAPNLNGMQLAEAQRVLQESGLQMSATLAGAAPNRSAVGRVAKQKPQSGQELAAGTVVELWVYGETLAGEPVPRTPVVEQTSGVPFITIPVLPAGKAIYEQACGSNRTGLQYTPGQRYLRPTSQFIKNDQTRGFCAANPSGFSISATWLEPSDSRNSTTGQSYLQKNTCSASKTQPQLKRSKMTYDSSSGLPIIELASIIVHSSKSRAFVAIQDMADAYLEKHQVELVRIAETMLAEIEPYAMNCSGQTTAASGSYGSLNLCKDPTIQDDSYALKYARGYGGGETTYFIRQNHFCHKQGYSKVVGNKVDYYECRDADFKDCSLKSSTSAERKEIGDGAYQLIFDGGKSWWTIRPRQ